MGLGSHRRLGAESVFLRRFRTAACLGPGLQDPAGGREPRGGAGPERAEVGRGMLGIVVVSAAGSQWVGLGDC